MRWSLRRGLRPGFHRFAVVLSLYEIPMLIWFIWRAFHWKRNDKDWLKGTVILAIAVVAPVLLWLSAWYAPVLLWLSALVCVD